MVACRTKCTSHYLVMVSNLMTFAILVRIFISCVLLPKWLSVIRGMKRKPYLSAVWTCYHFVAITNLRQPRPGDSADMNTRLQLSDTSSIRHAWWIPLILHIEKSIIHSSSQKNFFQKLDGNLLSLMNAILFINFDCTIYQFHVSAHISMFPKREQNTLPYRIQHSKVLKQSKW